MLILWRKFSAEGEIFYGIDGTNGIDEERRDSEFREIREFKEFKEGTALDEDERDDRDNNETRASKK